MRRLKLIYSDLAQLMLSILRYVIETESESRTTHWRLMFMVLAIAVCMEAILLMAIRMHGDLCVPGPFFNFNAALLTNTLA